MDEIKQPVHVIIKGRTRISIWEHETDGQIGRFSVTVSQIDQPSHDWKEWSTCIDDDLPDLMFGLDQVYSWIWMERFVQGRLENLRGTGTLDAAGRLS